MATLYEHRDTVTALDYLPDSHYFMSGSRDGTVKIYDLNSMDEYTVSETHEIALGLPMKSAR
jgi:WD40 repeat protein